MPDRAPPDARWIVPSWPAPAHVRAFVTTRDGGVSRGPWSGADGGGMNLGLGSGDDRDDVLANRTRLRASLPAEPAWLRQIHGAAVVDAATVSAPIDADASFATAPDVVCSVLVADCMPVFLADRAGTRVAVAHAGWRGLAAGVLEATVAAGGFEPAETLAWLGPAIGPDRFEVGDDVRDAFVEAAPTNADAVAAAFAPQPDGKWLADLPRLATLRLASCGVSDVTASGLCTASDARRFYSYRRDRVTGRMAAVVWIEP